MSSANNLKESGNFHYKNKNFLKAMEYYMKSLEVNPNEPAVYYNLSMTQFQLHKYEDSLKNSTHAIDLDPKYKKAYYRRLQCNIKLGNHFQVLADSKRYLELEDPAEPLYSEVKRQMIEHKTKLADDSNCALDIRLFNHKRSNIPQYLQDVKQVLNEDSVGIVYLKEMLKKVTDASQLSYNTAELTKLEEIKTLIYTKMLEFETPENCLEILDILYSLAKDSKGKESRIKLLKMKVDIAKKCKLDEVALSTLRQLLYLEGKEDVLKMISEFNVPSDDQNDQKPQQPNQQEEEEKCDSASMYLSSFSSNGVVNHGNSPTTKAIKQKTASTIVKVKTSAEQTKQSNSFVNGTSVAKSTLIDNKNQDQTSTHKKTSKQQQKKQQSVEKKGASKSHSPTMSYEIKNRLLHLQTHHKLEDFIDIIEKLLAMTDKSIRRIVLEQISNFECFETLKKSMSENERQLIKSVMINLPTELVKRYEQ